MDYYQTQYGEVAVSPREAGILTAAEESKRHYSQQFIGKPPEMTDAERRMFERAAAIQLSCIRFAAHRAGLTEVRFRT